MEDKLIELLSTFGYPVIRQGSLTPDEPYPDTFFTFWNNEESEQSAYDNNTLNVLYNFDVNIYSNDPTTTYSLLRDARKLLKNNGFVTPSRGYDVASDEDTHTGRGMNVLILNNDNLSIEPIGIENL